MPRISIAVKNAIIYFVLLVCTSVFLGYSIFKISSNKIIENATSSLNHNNELVVTQFKTFINDIQKDIEFISKNPFLYEYISKVSDKNLESNLSKDFLALLSTSKQYLQLRLIGIENNGRELIRVEKFAGGSKIVDKNNLQKKGDRDYFIETLELPPDSVYFSEINLNQEYGKITIPIVPTMRIAKTIYTNGQAFGIVVVNIDLRYVFDELRETAGKHFKLTLLNQDGYYLIHPDSSKTFGFEFGKNPPMELIPAFKFIGNKSQYQDQNELYSIIHYSYKKTGYPLFFSLSADKKMLFSVFNEWKSDLAWLTLLITMVSLTIAIWWTRRQSKVFSSLIHSITDFGRNPETVSLQINRDDEIGDVSKSFQEMADKINIHLRERELAKTEAEEANRAKQEFLENMSHEIRNPLQSILGITGMLAQNNPRPDQEALINTLKFSSENLLALVNDILDYRKLIHGQIELQLQSIQLDHYLDNIIKSHTFDASNKKIRLRLQLDQNLTSKLIHSDPVRLSQILHNLLSNAIRYSRAGHEVILTVRILNSQSIEFTISDQGPGISAENIKNILQQKPVSGSSRQLQNVGLGLPIVLNLLKLFNSTLEIDSKEGSGSHFKFILPIHFVESPKTNAAPKSNSHFLQSFIHKAACIEDDSQNVFLYSEIFKKLNITLENFSSPEELLVNTQRKYDLILTDINFEFSNLMENYTKIQNCIHDKGLIIIISASEEQTIQLDQKTISYDAYLKKPISTIELINELSECLFRKLFEYPDFTQLQQNYDLKIDKIVTALELTVSEWLEMHESITKAIVLKDTVLLDKVLHKLINTTRTFRLTYFYNLLENVRIDLNSPTQDIEALKELVSYPFIKYIEIFKNEIKKRTQAF